MDSYEEYVKHPGLSRSYLVSLLFNPAEREYKTSDSLDRGIALDTLVTQGSVKFDALYANEPTPSTKGDIYKIAKAYAKGEDYKAVYENSRLKTPLKDIEDTLEKNITWEKYIKDYKRLHDEGKILISKEDKAIIFNAYTTLLKDKDAHAVITNLHNEYQVPVYGEIDGVLCKGLIDILVIDEEKKEITPYDLKSTSDYVLDFTKSYYKYRYDIQGSFYHELIKINYPNYKINNFRFLVVSLEKPGPPYIFEMSDEEIFGARNGRVKFERYYKGYRELIKDYKYHKDTNNWSHIADYLRDGKLVI